MYLDVDCVPGRGHAVAVAGHVERAVVLKRKPGTKRIASIIRRVSCRWSCRVVSCRVVCSVLVVAHELGDAAVVGVFVADRGGVQFASLAHGLWW
jgi:hypothetical protein